MNSPDKNERKGVDIEHTGECIGEHFGPCFCAPSTDDAKTAALRKAAVEAAKKCGTCSRIKIGEPLPFDLSRSGPPETCLGKCTREISYYSCAPGYCVVCAHDPRWRSIDDHTRRCGRCGDEAPLGAFCSDICAEADHQERAARRALEADKERMEQLWRRAALDLGEARAVLEWWRDAPDAFPGGAAEVVEKLFGVLGVKESRRG